MYRSDGCGAILKLDDFGKLSLLTELSKKTPESLVALLRIPGIGPKRAKLIYKSLGVKTMAQLQKAAKAGRLSELPGLGKTTEEAILRGIEQDKAHSARTPIATAEAYIRPLVEALNSVGGASGNAVFPTLPLTVLTDDGTASSGFAVRRVDRLCALDDGLPFALGHGFLSICGAAGSASGAAR